MTSLVYWLTTCTGWWEGVTVLRMGGGEWVAILKQSGQRLLTAHMYTLAVGMLLIYTLRSEINI